MKKPKTAVLMMCVLSVIMLICKQISRSEMYLFANIFGCEVITAPFLPFEESPSSA